MKLMIGEGDMKSLKKVRHTNELNSTLSSIPLSAKRLLFLALSQINSRKEINIDDVIHVSAQEFSFITSLDVRNCYKHLKDGADTLLSIKLLLEKDEIKSIKDHLGIKGDPNQIKLNLTDYCAYIPDEARVAIRFSRAASIYISSIIGVERKYTTQALISVVRLSSTHATTLYQLIRKMIGLSVHRYGKSFTIEVDQLRKEMGLIDKDGNLTWSEYPIFKRDVLNKAIKEINEKTEIFNLSFDVVSKLGRKVNEIRFNYIVDEDEFRNSFVTDDDRFILEFDKMFPEQDNE